ncbi:TetR/AcrR family transcriptional regulator [Streptomyces sp. 4N509B]|uniref:TetR/AcrR family transcriptional regulator n=1 Tax=Streptomyces sp. 4N509B TaxID=3457413 RepID=UPI003FCF7D19
MAERTQAQAPPKQRRGRDTVERLLRAALAVYDEAGPEGFTLTAVTDASGVSVGSLYHHFGSFDGLAAELYARALEDLFDAVTAAVRAADGPRAAVRDGVTAYLRWSGEHAVRARIIHASPYAGYLRPQTARLREGRQARLGLLLEALAPHLGAAGIRPMPPAVLETLVVGPVTVAVTRWLDGVPGFDLDEALRLLPDRVWASVRGPDAEPAPEPAAEPASEPAPDPDAAWPPAAGRTGDGRPRG